MMKRYYISQPIKLGILYTFFVLLLSTVVTIFLYNYGESYQELRVVIKLIFILLLFLPLVIFNSTKDFTLARLGFKFNWKSVILTIGIVLFLGIAPGFESSIELSFGSKIVEGMAGTGEEFFFRGFIYLIILQMIKSEKYKNLGAMVISSIIFTIAHTEILLGVYHFGLFNMFFNTFITFAVVRHFSKSLLPVVAIHTFMNGGIVSCITGILITSVIMFASHVKENKSIIACTR